MMVIQGLAGLVQSESNDTVEAHANKIVCKSEDLLGKSEKQRSITNLLLEPPEVEEVEVLRLLKRNVAYVSQKHADATIELDCPDGLVATASTRIDQAVQELLTNSIVHNDNSTAKVTVKATSNQDYVSLEITDNGPPIPEIEQELGTGGRELDPLYHGSGLGQWLVYWIVTRSNGLIYFEQREPRGNRVKIELPPQTRCSSLSD
jgi:signal transduction histidine kinase